MRKRRDLIIGYVRRKLNETGKPPTVRNILKTFRMSSKTFYKLFPKGIEELYATAIPFYTNTGFKNRTSKDEISLRIEKTRLREDLYTVFFRLNMLRPSVLSDPKALSIMESMYEILDMIDEEISNAKSMEELIAARKHYEGYRQLIEEWLQKLEEIALWKEAHEKKVQRVAEMLLDRMIGSGVIKPPR